MASFQVGGLASGIDTEGLIDQLVQAASVRKSIMQSRIDKWDDRKDAYATLASRLDSLKTAFEDLDTTAEFRSVSATTEDESLVSVSTTGDAVAGRFEVVVQRMASSAMDVSSAFTDRTSDGTFATGTLAITYGGTTTNLAIDASNSSLDDVVDAINDGVEGVTAYVMETGDAANPYRLVVTGDDTGADNALTLDTSGLDAMTGTVPTFTEVTAAEDAWVQLNGVDIYDADNDIDGAVEGVTFTLEDEDPLTSVTIDVERDTDAMVTKMQTLVDAYNSVLSHVRAQSVYNPDEDMVGAFVGESAANSVVNGLQSVLGGSYAASAVYESLSQLGLSTTQDGDLEFDSEAFQEALDADFEEVVSLFTHETEGVAAAFTAKIDTYIDEDDGSLVERQDSLDDQITDMEDRITDFEDRMTQYEDRLRSQFTAMEIAMAKFNTSSNALLALMPDFTSSNSNSD